MRRAATTIVLACALLAVLASAAIHTRLRPTPAHKLSRAYTFERYIREYRKPYTLHSSDYAKRKAHFQAALDGVLRHNANPARTYDQGINHLSDWTAAELRSARGGRVNPEFKSKFEVPFKSSGAPIAPSVDYRLASPAVLTAVKDQGMCGDCWAHAVTEAVESAYARSTGNLLVLSQQQVTSCTANISGCYSCDGNLPRHAYDYLSRGGPDNTHGLVEEWRYPFTSWNGSMPACDVNRLTPAKYPFSTSVEITGYTQVPFSNQTAVMEALSTLGPLSILVDASFWSPYAGGVFNGCQAYNGTQVYTLDHAVLLVGYGHDAATDLDYWIVRNSWSASWGEHGYIRIVKTAVPQCGLDFGGMSCFATNNTQPTPSCGMCGILSDAQVPIVNASP